MSAGVLRATYELAPAGMAEAFAIEESTGMADGPAFVRGRVVEEGGGRAVIEFPAANWGANVPLLVSSLVAGEATEDGAFTRCRLVGLDLPEGFLPGPALGGAPDVVVGVIVKPSLGLSPAEVAERVAAATGAGARFVKDDELLGDPEWCPLEERVRAVAAVLPPGVTYCANVTGPVATLVERARRVVELGATGLLVNAVAQGLDSVLALRRAGLGVPLVVHRAGSGPWTRNPAFGVSGAVLTSLFRWCGADVVMAGAFGGKLFETPEQVRANLAAAHLPLLQRAPLRVAQQLVVLDEAGAGPGSGRHPLGHLGRGQAERRLDD
ncbi:MAG TPA: RuBisCO large subunit C-terminal-like domain-containing protein, partial [Acidimicrobiales bacterium]|nr:RuBisCO large subunit C-terminal-like domain-containing protein [Acidimicrobiales bacterium]